MVAYGALFHSINASSQQEDDSVKLAELEAALVKATLAGGVNQDCSDKIKQTHTGKAPKARPT